MPENIEMYGGTKSKNRTNRTATSAARSAASALKKKEIQKKENQDRARADRASKREKKLFVYEDKIVKEQQYWELVNKEGFEILAEDGSIAKCSNELLKNPTTSDIWHEFYTEYIKYIEDNIEQNSFKHYGFDLHVKQIKKKYDMSMTSADTIKVYNMVIDEIREILTQYFGLCSISKDALRHLLESIELHTTSDTTFYTRLITIAELMFDARIFRLFMTDYPDGTELTQTKFNAIWLRRAPIWGIGEETFMYGGVRNFIQNYFKKLIRYAIKHNKTYSIIAINPHIRQNPILNSLLGGTGQNNIIKSIDIIKENIMIEYIRGIILKFINQSTTTYIIKFRNFTLPIIMFKSIDSASAKSAPIKMSTSKSKSNSTSKNSVLSKPKAASF